MTLIIGKRSNLSKKIFEQFDDCVLISSSEIDNNLESILKYCNSGVVNIILNNFQASVLLNDDNDFDDYIIKSLLNTSRILSFLINNNIVINKLIYTSSSSVYGNNKFCSENDQVKPMSLQAALKISNEELIKRICAKNQINYTIARVFNMYGGDDKFSVISKIKDSCLNKKTLNIINGGRAIRDYINIDDVVYIYKVLIYNRTKYPTILNVASGNGKRVIDIINSLKSRGVVMDINNIQRDEIKASVADVTLLGEIVDTEKLLDVKNFLFNKLS
ncbi:NAD(P)-dependent oxidoreductase [Sulfurimonas sp.]|uniref:NAD-dependent epimerase/dehydratase family protein n=1 Tax=Sulfurimonas sp. TaxID=2022749 RepID=UPI00260A06A3|nr:NAD-dependent epimerase/dehydratase family protein [Sulfurimonas sp.]MCW8895349.1 NAD-dependent epimerase/dehydratase family protein [Sulfurimonas sp.]